MVDEAYAESTIRGRAAVDAVKAAIIAHEGRSAVEPLYPAWFPTDHVVVSDITEEDLVDTEGEWIFTNDDLTKDDMEDVLARLGQTVQTMSGSDIERVRAMESTIPDDEGWI
jgi:hypothetical protein